MLIYAGKVDNNIKKHYQSDKLCFSERFLNMKHIAAQSDVAVCHAGHNIVMLLEGKPLLTLPMFLEQEITGRRVENIGAGVLGNPKNIEKHPGKMLRELLANESYSLKANDFAKKYRSFDSREMLDKAALRCMKILS